MKFMVSHRVEEHAEYDERPRYLFGNTEVIPLKEMQKRLSTLLDDVQKHSQPDAGPVCTCAVAPHFVFLAS